MSMGRDDVFKLRPLTYLLFIPPDDIFEYEESWWNYTDRAKEIGENLSQ
jgi:hypothetical protein